MSQKRAEERPMQIENTKNSPTKNLSENNLKTAVSPKSFETRTGTKTPTNLKSIPNKPKTPIPGAVLDACKKLKNEGTKTWLAGGCVRDMILGVKPRDWDIVTDASLETICKVFPKHLDVGVNFGIVKLIPGKSESDPQIDIAIFRKESGYSDLRHPDKIDIGDELTDSARRDFTVNALYFDPFASVIYDYVDGYRDIGLKILRTVGDPQERFQEDALRILRAARFSAQLGFKIDPATMTAMKKYSKLLSAISRERVREETFRLLNSPRPVVGLESLAKNALWEQVFDVKRISIPADFRSLKFIEKPNALAWLCALGVTGLLGDPTKEPEKILSRMTQSMKFSNDEKKIFSKMILIFEESVKQRSYPLEWIEVASCEKSVVELCKRFIRRARGVTIEEKERAIKLIELSQRWAMKKNFVGNFPNAQELIKEGFKEGPKLGAELKSRQWATFWKG